MSKTISTLIIKQLMGEITPQERIELDNYAAQSEENRRMVENYTNKKRVLEEVKLRDEWLNEDDWRKIKKGLPGKVISMKTYLAVAAAIVTVIGTVAFLWIRSNQQKQPDHAKNNTVDNEFFKAVVKKGKGEKPDTGVDTVETYKKSYYSRRLPDGSIVWLNCASSLLVPASFSDTERVVRLKGEAYFEIVENVKRPFKVQVSGMEIVVTGTKFNVKAYSDEGKVRTTLVDGSVKIRTKNKTDSLKKFEQALLTSSGKLEKKGPDSFKKTTLAWKENKFDWDEEHLETIIADLCRWHGLKAVYTTNVSYGTYSATISRSRPLYQTLAILEGVTPFKFTVEDQFLIIRQR